MLTPKYLDSIPDEAVALWQSCEDDILRDMARLINECDYYCPASKWQENRLRTAGMARQDIIKRLSEYTGKSEATINKLMLEAGKETIAADTAIVSAAKAYTVTQLDKAALNGVLRAGSAQTNKAMRNICRTTANTASRQFERVLDRAWMQVLSGAFSQQAAIQSACKTLADTGIQSITYAKKTDTIEVAVRRAVRTGVNQTALKLTDDVCNQLGVELVEVTAHAGARPEHAEWQGKVYSRGQSSKYPDFVRSTGYGTGSGLGGWNCRHSFGPYIEGCNRVYTDEKLAEMNSKTRTYNGAEMSEYDAEQYARRLERTVRKYKRQVAAGVDGAEARLETARIRANDFSRKVGFKRQYGRDYTPNR